MWTDVSFLSGGTGASITPEERIPRKNYTKSPAEALPRKDPISNEYINRLITKYYPNLPPIMAKYLPGSKPIFNDTHDPNSIEDDPNDFKDNSRNKK